MTVRYFSICDDLICLGFALCEAKKEWLARIGRSARVAMKWRNND
jgi:hypothetical protein